MTSPLWKPLAPLFPSTTFVNRELVEFRHIDEDCGNGVIAKKEFDKNSKTDLIIESALICAISKADRKSSNCCTLCGAFLLPSKDETDDTSKFSSILKLADKIGFSKLPVWFQKSCCFADSKTFKRRCVTCDQQRVLCSELPQSLEEVVLAFSSHDENKKFLPFKEAAQQVDEIANEIDEALFSVLRAILMLFDEVVFEMKKKKEQEEEINATIHEKFSEKLDDFCSFFDEGVVPSNSCNSNSALVFRTASELANRILNGIFFNMIIFNEDDDDENSFSKMNNNNTTKYFFSLQQFFLLRCILQNNQHKALVPNPIAMMTKVVSEKITTTVPEDEEEDKMMKEFLENRRKEEEEKEQHITCSALFLHTARLNHSCFPNAHVEPSLTRSGASVRISVYNSEEKEKIEEVSTTTVKAKEQITISYLGYDETKMFQSQKDAHEYLKKNYGFECRDLI
jgi:hypothetical protein